MHYGMPLRNGFWPEKTLTIAGNQPNVPRVSLLADGYRRRDLNNSNLHLFTSINGLGTPAAR
jgi:hypothetical protein